MSDETLGIPTYVSLCSGYDGIGLGLKRVIPNLQTLAHCEIEAYAIAGLIAKMETGQLDACPVFSDISDFPFEDLRGQIGILSAGFPCQPFSSAGRRQSTEDPRHIWPRIADGISVCLPRYCFFENVPGIISAKTADGESVLKYVLGDLEQRGYSCAWGLFSAEETGAPHQRIRCFILARLGNPASLRPRGGSENRACEQSEVLGEGLESDGELAHSNRDEQTEERGDDGEVLKVPQVEGQELSPTLLGGESTQGAELAHPASRQPGEPQARNGGQDIGGGSEEELGDTGIKRCEQDPALRDKQQARGVEQVCGDRGSEEELAHSEGDDEQGRDLRQGEVQLGRGCSRDGEPTEWPARPGEEQYDWEEPRVVAHRKDERCGGRKDKDGKNGEGISEQAGEERPILRGETAGCCGDEETTLDEIEPELGGSPHVGQGDDGMDATPEGVDAIVNRVDRLRLLGNGVVPQCAELAWRTLWKQLNDKHND